MKTCPFCFGDVPDAALKCQHCGEWIERPPTRLTGGSDDDDSVGRAANRYVSFQMIMGVIGLLLFLLMFLFVILPHIGQTGGGFGSPSVRINVP